MSRANRERVMGVRCTICRSESGVKLDDRSLGRYSCSLCGHSFTVLEPGLRTQYTDDYYASKKDWFANPNYWLFGFINDGVRRHFGSRNIRFLDAGCGRGDFLKFIQKANPGWELYGIDLSENRLPGINYMRQDFLSASCGAKFDVITSLAAIEHVEDITLFVRKISELLAPGGIAVVNTDNTGGVFYSAARLLNRLGMGAPYRSLYELAHLQHFTNKSLRTLLEKEGFEIISQTNHNYPIKAVDLPPCGLFMKCLYLSGVALLFAMPRKFGILQTVFFRKRVS